MAIKKNIGFEEGRKKMIKGLEIAARAVGGTIGPRGQNVYLSDPMVPRITNDGVSIASRVMLADPEEDAGAWIIRAATGRASDEAGDGTTTTAVLCASIAKEALSRPENPTLIRQSLNAALPKVVAAIKAASHKAGPADLRRIALVSAEYENIAEMVASVIEKKGEDAHITIDDSMGSTSYVEMSPGYEAKVGWLSPFFVTNPQKQVAEFRDTLVLCTHRKIDSINQLLPLYNKLNELKITKLVIVAADIDLGTLGVVVDNKLRGTFSTLAIRATGELLDDIAAVVGAIPLSEQTGVDFHDIDIKKHLGRAQFITCNQEATTFVAKDNKSAKEKAKQLEGIRENATSDLEKRTLGKRIAKLLSGVAVIYIGALSEQERGYLKDKADDAVRAVKSAMAEGYVEGGGMCLYRISSAMKAPTTIGEQILKRALTAPLRAIIENAGLDYAEIVKRLTDERGFDAKEEEYVNLISRGIIDPAKVERIAIESAVSSVGEMITTHALITDYEDTKKA